MSFEHGKFPDNNSDRLRVYRILEEGYGPNFNSERARQLFERASCIVETKNHLGATAGLAILGDQAANDTRIMMACAFRDADARGSERYVELLRVCTEEQFATWMSVGIQHAKIQDLCQYAGFDQSSDGVRIQRLVSPLHAPHDPIMNHDTSGKIIVRGVQNLSGLGQYIFTYDEQSPLQQSA